MPPKKTTKSKPLLDTRNDKSWDIVKNHLEIHARDSFFGNTRELNEGQIRSYWDEIDLVSYEHDIGKLSGRPYYDTKIKEVIARVARERFRTELRANPSLAAPTNVLQATGWMDVNGNLTRMDFPPGWSELYLETKMLEIYRKLGMTIKYSMTRPSKKSKTPTSNQDQPSGKDQGTKRNADDQLLAPNSKKSKSVHDGQGDNANDAAMFDTPPYSLQLKEVTSMRIAIRNDKASSDQAVKRFPISLIVSDDHRSNQAWEPQHIDFKLFQGTLKDMGYIMQSDSVFWFPAINTTAIVEVGDESSLQTAVRQQMRHGEDMYARFYILEREKLNNYLAPMNENSKGTYIADLAVSDDDEE